MKSDLPPLATTLEQEAWVEAELVRSFMQTAQSTQLAGTLLVPVFIGVLWTDASAVALFGWATAALLVALLRFASLRDYHREGLQADPAEQLAVFNRQRYLWPVSALVWGASTLLYFDRAPLADQFVCWLVVAGLAMFSINSLSSHLPTLRSYLNMLVLTALAVMAWRIVVDLQLRGPFFHYWLIVVLLILWQVLLQAGQRLHATHRRNFELQFRNRQLIESLTRQKQAALDAVEIKNRFLASAAHDIRQPVHALGLYADWLSNEPELVREIAPKIVQSTRAVNALFDALFDLVRLDSGNIRLDIGTVQIDKLLHELELQYRPLAEAKGLAFRVRGAHGTAVSDPILLRRLVGNLLSNAIKYTQRGGVLLAARATPRGLRLEVWDTGIGIAKAHQRDIFREFYKVPTHGGTEDGFGLGLYIVARLADILGHPLRLASRPGRGTVFRLALEPTDAGRAAERAAASVAQWGSRP